MKTQEEWIQHFDGDPTKTMSVPAKRVWLSACDIYDIQEDASSHGKDLLTRAYQLIGYIGTTGVERSDVLKRAEEWMGGLDHDLKYRLCNRTVDGNQVVAVILTKQDAEDVICALMEHKPSIVDYQRWKELAAGMTRLVRGAFRD